jgi:hypothetical protein
MKLTQEEKDQLAEHYRNQDLYDPSKAPEQEVADFAPEGMNCGGEMGYAGGGQVPEIDLGLDLMPGASDYAGPSISGGTETARVPLSNPPDQPAPRPAMIGSIPQPPQAVARPPLPRPSLLDAPESPEDLAAVPDSSGASDSPLKSLKSDEYNQLMQFLQPSRGQRIGRAAMSGLAGLADSIMTGVAKAPSSSFQKNLADKEFAQNKELTDALRQKYEAGFKGEELSQASKRLAEDVRGRKEDEKLGRGQSLSGASPSTVRIRDSQGGIHDLPASSLAAAKKRDPGLQVVP